MISITLNTSVTNLTFTINSESENSATCAWSLISNTRKEYCGSAHGNCVHVTTALTNTAW